jgi:hypothetical protein
MSKSYDGSDCNVALHAAGLPHTRTCNKCGFGPCSHPVFNSKFLHEATPLNSAEAQLKDIFNRLGVQGHAGAVTEIERLRAASSLPEPTVRPPMYVEYGDAFTAAPVDEEPAPVVIYRAIREGAFGVSYTDNSRS